MEAFFLGLEDGLASLGPWGAVLAVLLMAAVSVLPIPAEVPAVMNGMIFGPVIGTMLSYAGALLGAVVSFELARSMGRPLAVRFLGDRTLARVDTTVSQVGWGGLLVARLIPVIAFTALNWGIGLTTVPRRRFFWTTAVGILPGVILFTTFGSAVPTLFRQQPVLTAVGTAVFLALVLLASSRVGSRGPTESDEGTSSG